MSDRPDAVRTLGVLGGGQLGWMLGVAARRLGIECVFLDPSPQCPSDMVGRRIAAPYDDPEALDRLAGSVDVVTYEFENVPAGATEALAGRVPVRPGPRSLEVSQDRLVEKSFISGIGVAVPEFREVSDESGLRDAIEAIGPEAILKSRRGGYDGKGQVRIDARTDPAEAFAAIGGVPAILEAMVPFDLEASTLVVRSLEGECRTWAPIRNEHAGGILRRSDAPGPGIPEEADELMKSAAIRIAEELDHVGVLAVEYFVIGDRVLVNEIAPRVHNSGHLTIEHAETSQFENHVRAVVGLPLGSTAARVGRGTMLNAIGEHPTPRELVAAGVESIDEHGDASGPLGPGCVRWHDYRKSPRTGRKVGHLTIVDESIDESWIARLAALVPGATEAPSLSTEG